MADTELLTQCSSHNRHRLRPKCSTTARVTRSRWPTRKSHASVPYSARSTSYKSSSTKCDALEKSSRDSSRVSTAWIAAYEAAAPSTHLSERAGTDRLTLLHFATYIHVRKYISRPHGHNTLSKKGRLTAGKLMVVWTDWKPHGCWRFAIALYCTVCGDTHVFWLSSCN